MLSLPEGVINACRNGVGPVVLAFRNSSQYHSGPNSAFARGMISPSGSE
jgi:hypothetical protein